ncbi:tRNA (guanosine(37)-N1)-methyltransferase TrmD [Dehalococcoidia bacterium]|nr:tRNA (guanosine(37)-N1)-methyltransferase TrmD [Dehalococcoidia bacterium]
MNFTILTLFPAMFAGPLGESIVKRAIDNGIVRVSVRDIRDYTFDKHNTADDYPYGGGVGMVMKPEPIFEAVEDSKRGSADRTPHVVLLTPQGRVFNQTIAQELTKAEHLILICGHYEGVDERVSEYLADDEISIGDFVMTGGEPAALVIVDSVVRLLPGALGDPQSGLGDSFASGLLQYPQYTRPAEFRGWKVPDVLLSGDHGAVERWRRHQSILRTSVRRPDMITGAGISSEDLTNAQKEGGDISGDISQ